MSDRTSNGPTPGVCLCSATPTSLPWMSFISLLALRGTLMWGRIVFNGAPDGDMRLFPVESKLDPPFQVDWPIRAGVATLVGAAWRPGQGGGRNHLYVFVCSPVGVCFIRFWHETYFSLQTSPWRTLCTKCCTAVTLIERRLIRTEHARRKRNRRSPPRRLHPRMGRSPQNLVRNITSALVRELSSRAS